MAQFEYPYFFREDFVQDPCFSPYASDITDEEAIEIFEDSVADNAVEYEKSNPSDYYQDY